MGRLMRYLSSKCAFQKDRVHKASNDRRVSFSDAGLGRSALPKRCRLRSLQARGRRRPWFYFVFTYVNASSWAYFTENPRCDDLIFDWLRFTDEQTMACNE